MNTLIKIYVIFFIFTISKAQDQSFVELTKINPNIVLDIRYATKNNFLKKVVYTEARCFVRPEVAVRLDSIQKELEYNHQ